MTTHFVDTPLLRIGYELSGPPSGFPVVLVHGWPDDAMPSAHWTGCIAS
jgi:pimeloyl-ACP methyl ester carboxylesterase